MKKAHVVALAALLLAPPVVLAQAETPAAASKPSRDSLTLIRQRGKLLACVPPHAPWVIHGAEGKLKGFSVDLAGKLAEDLNVSVEYVVEESARLLPSLVEGDCDVIAGGLSATPQRALFAHFSDPVARHDIVLVADKAASAGWRRPEDLDRPDVSVGYIAGGVLAPHVKRLFAKAKLVELADWSALGAALQSGQVKAAVLAEPRSGIALKLAPDKLVAPLAAPLGRRTEAFAVRRGDLEFLAYLNTWVDAHRNDGWLEERRRQWFLDLGWVDQP
ncbi:MAG TPA: transporter substrate-binding domain-containing protein [Vicinamibacteria bacterium]|nr:transporter substrate-binding domain-containing protein [Vicinamibacteria bacterium]